MPVEPEQAQLSESEKSIIAELNKVITECKSALPIDDVSDLQVLDVFASVKVLGLGEATHGTKEFFQMKHRIFKYFVEKHGFKIFGFEADMAECIHIDRFINGNYGTINDAMNKMHFWTWKTEEVKELILWMKQYNEGKNEKDKIHLIGVDCQYIDQNKQLILEYLDKYDKNYPLYLEQLLDTILDKTISTIYSMSANEIKTIKAKCDSVTNYFNENKSRLISSSGEFEYKLIQRLTIQTKQVYEVSSDDSFNFRDYYMAENAEWLTTLKEGINKVALWAHNGHLSRNSEYAGSGSLGHFLNIKLGNNYKVIGFAFCTGTFRGRSYELNFKLSDITVLRIPPNDFSNFFFYHASPSDFILVNSIATKSAEFYNWYNTPLKFFSAGAAFSQAAYERSYYLFNLTQVFDAIISFKKTAATVAYQ